MSAIAHIPGCSAWNMRTQKDSFVVTVVFVMPGGWRWTQQWRVGRIP